jgi:hypothetical protein
VEDGPDIHVLDSVPQSAADALAELRTLNDNPAWLDRVTAYWRAPALTNP